MLFTPHCPNYNTIQTDLLSVLLLGVVVLWYVLAVPYFVQNVQSTKQRLGVHQEQGSRIDSLNQNLTLKLKIYLMLETTANIYTCDVGR